MRGDNIGREMNRFTVVGWPLTRSPQMDSNIDKIFLNIKCDANKSKENGLKHQSTTLNSFSFLFIYFCIILATVCHCCSINRQRYYAMPKHKYLFLKSFKRKGNSKLSFIGPKLIVMCAFLLCYDTDRNIDPDLEMLKKLNKIDFLSI